MSNASVPFGFAPASDKTLVMDTPGRPEARRPLTPHAAL